MQVLIAGPGSMLGSSAIVRITSVGRWSVFGEVIKTLTVNGDTGSKERSDCGDNCSSRSNLDESCVCLGEPEACACGPDSCGGQNSSEERGVLLLKNDTWAENQNSSNIFGWLLRKRKNHNQKRTENVYLLEPLTKQDRAIGSSIPAWGAVDRALLGGMCVSLVTVLALFLYLGSRILSP